MGSCPGGVANQAIAAARLGLRTGLAAAFGDDGYGDYNWKILAGQEHVDLSSVPADSGLALARHGVPQRRRADRFAHRRPARLEVRRRRSWCSTTSSAAGARTSPGAGERGRVTIVEGDIRDRAARRRGHGGHRRRLPSGGDPHHAVRRGAARSRSTCSSTARSTCSRRRSRPASARSSPHRRPRSTASPSSSRPTEQHHPYNNRTLYGAAKAFNEGLLRSFNDMYGLDYVALRYFNVYGPRMDIARRLHRSASSAGWSASRPASRR